MPKIKSPFCSISAQGTLGGVLTSFTHFGRSYIISKLRRKSNRQGAQAGFGRFYFGSCFFGYSGKVSLTTKQQTQGARRLVFSASLKAYNLLTPLEKTNLEIEAKNMQMTGLNLYLSRFIFATGI